MISYLRFSNTKTIHIHWANTGWVSASFLDLFEFDGINVIEDNNWNSNLPNYYYFFGPYLAVTKEDKVPKNLRKKLNPIFHYKYAIDCCYNSIPEHVKDIYRPYFARLKPSLKVKKRMADFLCDKEYVTLQVRNAPDWDNYFKNTDLEAYFKVVDEYPKDTYFYLSCMSEEVYNIFKDRYGERILQLPDKDYSNMIDAVSELYIMSKAKEMIVSFSSTFSECAYWLGGANAKVITVGTYQDFVDKKANAVECHKKIRANSEKLFKYRISENTLFSLIKKK